MAAHKVAVLYQAHSPPAINGLFKPMKPGGYRDSSADIAFALLQAGQHVILPTASPDPRVELDWCFPDTSEGINRALQSGANTLWANTVLYDTHPLLKLTGDLHIVGQNPFRAQRCDDKFYTNQTLRSHQLDVAHSALLSDQHDDTATLSLGQLTPDQLNTHHLHFPLILKPVRGRGSQGVTLVHNFDDLLQHARQLFDATESTPTGPIPLYGSPLILEEALPGIELTVTVMPPGVYQINGESVTKPTHWSLPPVHRFNHNDGIAPYNGVVAVIENSRVLTDEETSTPTIQRLMHHCDTAAQIVGSLAPIRIDARQDHNNRYLIFDLNMKPNMTGPARPARENQTSLVGLAAESLGWSYPDLLTNILLNAVTLKAFQTIFDTEDTESTE